VASRQATFLANNYRMTELQGAVAIAQLHKLPSIVQRRRAWCERLLEQVSDLPGLLPPKITDGAESSWWFFMVRVDPPKLRANADEFTDALRKEGLPVSAHYIGQCIYEYPMFTGHTAFSNAAHPFAERTYAKGQCPTAEAILDTCIILQVNESNTEEELAQTAHAIRRNADWFHRTR